MTRTDVRNSMISIVISHMEKYDNCKFDEKDGNALFKKIKFNLEKMEDLKWSLTFPLFHYTLSVQLHSGSEPGVVINWTEDTSIEKEWDRLHFVFNPSRLSGSDDYLTAYNRAMAII